MIVLFLKWTNPGVFFICFRPFKQTLQFLLQATVKVIVKLTNAIRREPKPVAEDSPTLVVGIESKKSVESILLLATASPSAEHLLLLVPENGVEQ